MKQSILYGYSMVVSSALIQEGDKEKVIVVPYFPIYTQCYNNYLQEEGDCCGFAFLFFFVNNQHRVAKIIRLYCYS